jgi:O-phospho-L-seryl-tRNASec:L-selenocysteinyl-tRNA synthase
MNPKNAALASDFVDATYIEQGMQSLRARENLVRVLLSQRRLPDEGWDDGSIESFLHELASMDSNNFIGNVGGGEREARIYSKLVRPIEHFERIVDQSWVMMMEGGIYLMTKF